MKPMSAQQRERHDRAECDDLCPACTLIEAAETQAAWAEDRGAHYFLTTHDYPEDDYR